MRSNSERLAHVSVALTTGVVVCAFLLVASAPAPAVVPGANGRIAFVSKVSEFGFPGIFVISPDGRNSVSVAFGQDPAWSPDGRSIAFSRPGSGLSAQIYVVGADGKGQRQLTSGNFDRSPSWSPDGRRIVFARGVNEAAELWVTNADGSGQMQLTHLAPKLLHVWEPEWSPDGRSIAFTAWEPGTVGNTQIFLVGDDGGGLRSLTQAAGVADYGPSWSPDGSRIVFYSRSPTQRPLGTWSVDVINADGTGRATLAAISTSTSEQYAIPEFNPSWSPNGRQIVFAGDRDGNREIYVMNADGSGPRRLTNSPAFDFAPTWQPAVDLSLVQRVAPRKPKVGETVRATIGVRNVGPRTGHAVTLTGSTSATGSVKVSAARGRCTSGRTFRCNLGELAGGAAVSVIVTVRAVRAAPLIFRAAVTTAEADATEANNRGSVSAVVTARRR